MSDSTEIDNKPFCFGKEFMPTSIMCSNCGFAKECGQKQRDYEIGDKRGKSKRNFQE